MRAVMLPEARKRGNRGTLSCKVFTVFLQVGQRRCKITREPEYRVMQSGFWSLGLGKKSMSNARTISRPRVATSPRKPVRCPHVLARHAAGSNRCARKGRRRNVMSWRVKPHAGHLYTIPTYIIMLLWCSGQASVVLSHGTPVQIRAAAFRA